MRSRFQDRLGRVEVRIQRTFAEACPVVFQVHGECRLITAIFEDPDAPVAVPGGGDIDDRAPAIIPFTRDIVGLKKGDPVTVNGQGYRVTHLGSDELGRTRVTLARGGEQAAPPVIDHWSKK